MCIISSDNNSEMTPKIMGGEEDEEEPVVSLSSISELSIHGIITREK
jgi:hypothetical protein